MAACTRADVASSAVNRFLPEMAGTALIEPVWARALQMMAGNMHADVTSVADGALAG